MAIALASFLVPRNNNTWFIVEDKYIRGGLQVAETFEDRDAINPINRKKGMICVVSGAEGDEDENSLWILEADLETWTKFEPGGSGGDAGPRQTVVHRVETPVPGLSYADFTLEMGMTVLVYRLSVNVPCVVQVHETESRNDTNPFMFVATEDHLVDDGSTTLTDGTVIRGRRYHIWSNQDEVPVPKIYFRILNPSEDPISVELNVNFKPIEA